MNETVISLASLALLVIGCDLPGEQGIERESINCS